MEHFLKQNLNEIGRKAKIAARELATLRELEKNQILEKIAESLIKNEQNILEANAVDIKEGKKMGLSEGLLDRLLLTEKRIEDMADSVKEIIVLKDPIGKISDMNINRDGLKIGKKTVPMGVIAIIYEARPNVTLDASVLCLKAGSSIILRGGKEAINSNISIAKAIRGAIKEAGYDENIVQIIEDTTRESSKELMQLKDYVDLLVPRGSASLINSVVENAKVPVLETGVGNCHIYVDESAKIDMAIDIIENAKTQRIGVCNAMESLLVHRDVSDEFYNKLDNIIKKYDIKVYGDILSREKLKDIKEAREEDYGMEYLDYAFSMKIVENVDEAIDHIFKYSTGHSEAIITENYDNAMKFLDEVDSACVYVNASTRFTDGNVFGFGAELGISTQKLHARGPVGLNELVSTKFIVLGNGQIRK